MNVYDFDNTIYNGDVTVDFYFYCLKKNIKIIKFIPKQIKGFILYKLNRINKTEMKEYFYSFIQAISNIDIEINNFWKKKEKNIKKCYLMKRKKDDVIISASPYFLIEPIYKRLDIDKLIASNVDKKTGIYDGLNCRGEEKVKRFYKEYPDKKVDEFYSDSYSDLPMAQIAQKAYLVKKDSINIWNNFK